MYYLEKMVRGEWICLKSKNHAILRQTSCFISLPGQVEIVVTVVVSEEKLSVTTLQPLAPNYLGSGWAAYWWPGDGVGQLAQRHLSSGSCLSRQTFTSSPQLRPCQAQHLFRIDMEFWNPHLFLQHYLLRGPLRCIALHLKFGMILARVTWRYDCIIYNVCMTVVFGNVFGIVYLMFGHRLYIVLLGT